MSLKPSRSIEKAASLCAFSWASAAVEGEPLVEGDTVRQSGHGVVERQLVNAVGRFRSRAQVDDVGRKAVAHDEKNGADHGDDQHIGGQQIRAATSRRHPARPRRSHQRVVHDANHEGEHDRGAMAAPARHRSVGAVDGERAQAEPKHECHAPRHRHSIRNCLRYARPCSATTVHGKNADAHDKAADFRRQREMPAADFKTDKAGERSAIAAPRRSRPARSR